MRIVEYENDIVYSYGSRSPVEVPFVGSAVTIGSYDGVHKGHRTIIARMAAVAMARSLRRVVVTFEPHPRRVLEGAVSGPLGLLTTLEEKIDLLSRENIDLLFVIRFTPDFAARSSDDFIRNVLVGLLGAKAIIIGYDHVFGRDRSGSGTTLETLGVELGFAVEVVDEVLIGNEHLSSTRIRRLLEAGKIEEANEFLGSPYMISGIVVDGRGVVGGFLGALERLQARIEVRQGGLEALEPGLPAAQLGQHLVEVGKGSIQARRAAGRSALTSPCAAYQSTIVEIHRSRMKGGFQAA